MIKYLFSSKLLNMFYPLLYCTLLFWKKVLFKKVLKGFQRNFSNNVDAREVQGISFKRKQKQKLTGTLCKVEQTIT